MNKYKIFNLLKNIVIFILMVSLVLLSGLPMQFYAYDTGFYYASKIWIIIYILLLWFIFVLVSHIDNKRKKFAGNWYEIRKPIDGKWFIRLLIFIFIFGFFNILGEIIQEHLGLGQALNQNIIENQIETFPVKIRLFIHIVIFGPLLEELVFRKVFMDLFFIKDNAYNNFFAVFLSGLIFGLMHENTLSLHLVFYSIPGIILAFIYRYSKDLRYPIVVHILNNLFSILNMIW